VEAFIKNKRQVDDDIEVKEAQKVLKRNMHHQFGAKAPEKL
jgi:hypothetical protein